MDLIPFLESISDADNCVTALQNNFGRYKAGQKFQYYNGNQEEHGWDGYLFYIMYSEFASFVYSYERRFGKLKL